MTCCVCGTGYVGEDILVYGCVSCGKGFPSNSDRNGGAKIVVSPYVTNRLRQTLVLRHQIPLGEAERLTRKKLAQSGTIPRLKFECSGGAVVAF